MNIKRLLHLLSVIALLRVLPVSGAEPSNAEPATVEAKIQRIVIGPELLVPIGDHAPSDGESQALLDVLERMPDRAWFSNMQQFIDTYPNSPWTPSVRSAFACACYHTGRTTPALDHFENAWKATRAYKSGNGKRVADYTLANYVELLSKLGRLEKLKQLLKEEEGRVLAEPVWQQKWDAAREVAHVMMTYPGMSYRCGTFALKAAASALTTNALVEALLDEQSPPTGFTLSSLAQLSEHLKLRLVPAARLKSSEIPVPSVVHWKQNHYAAIVERRDDLYHVVDPTFCGSRWLEADVVNSEASGHFLVPETHLDKSVNWRRLERGDSEKVVGKGYPNNIDDAKDKGCRTGPGQCPTACPPCPGMPVSWVSEPYINLWIGDEPLSYKASDGRDITLRLNYKQRDTRPSGTGVVSPPTTWNHNWCSFVTVRDRLPYYYLDGALLLYNWDATVYLAGGGVSIYSSTNTFDEESRIRFEPIKGVGKQGAAFRLIHPDGSQDIYDSAGGWRLIDGTYWEIDVPRTQSIDKFGNTNAFLWEGTGRVMKMIDYDGRTNLLRYITNSVPTTHYLLSEVEDPYGRIARFSYDTNKNITNIVDVAQLPTSLRYNEKGWPTNMTTPYGPTTFEYIETPPDIEGNFGGHDRISRAIKMTEPNGSKQLYLYRYDSESFMPSTYPSAEVPSGTPIGTIDDGSGTNAFRAVSFRNSFFWGRKQYADLSTENPTNFTATDYLKARMRHWLQAMDDLYVSGALSIERDPSPDGTGSGAKTFYDYSGKTANSRLGTSSVPAVMARVLPNGETEYSWVRYNKDGYPTNVVATFSSGGSVATRTNIFVYGTNIAKHVWSGGTPSTNYTTNFNLILKVVNWNGDTIGQFGGYETNTSTRTFSGSPAETVTTTSLHSQPQFATNALNEITTYTYGPRERISSIKTPSGLTITNIFDAGLSLTKSIDIEIGRTNEFSYTNGQLHTFTDERGLKLTNSWDPLLRLTATLYPDGTYMSNRYDKLDLAGTRDRRGNWTSYGYNAVRQLVAQTNALTNVTRYFYGSCGCSDLEAITNALNQVTTITYDQQVRPLTVTFPDGSQITRQYDLIGRITNVLDGSSRKFSYVYNHQGLITTISNSFGKLLSRVYDRLDRPTQITDANGVLVTNNFDTLDRPISRTYPDGGVERFGFSVKGLVTFTNQTNQITRFDYDPAQRLTAITNANLEVIRYAYDPGGALTNLLDGKNQKTVWKLDSFGYVTNKTDDLTNVAATFGYDAEGNLTTRWTPAKGTTTFAYDAVGNLTNIDYPTNADVRLTYDALKRLSTVVDATGTNVFTYTAVGQLASEDGPWTDDTVSYGYSQRLRTSFSLSQPGATAWSQSYAYDNAWRLQTLSSPAGSFTYAYPSSGSSSGSKLVQKLTLPNSAYITNAYDTIAQLTGTWLKNSSHSTLNAHSYIYDLVGQRTNTVRTDGSYANYRYDNIGQLQSTAAFESGNAPRLNEKFGYTYDAAHNLTQRTNNALVQTLNVNSLNRLTTATRSNTLTVAGAITLGAATNVTVNGLAANRYTDGTFAREGFTVTNGTNTFTALAQDTYGRTASDVVNVYLPDTASFQYDSNGNLLSDGTKGFEYDDENQLVHITATNSWKSDFVYDGLLRRKIRREYTWSNGAWIFNSETRYVYDGMLVIQERDGNNVPKVTYTRGLDLSSTRQSAGGIGGMLARTDSAGSSYYHGDGSGNVTMLINTQQVPVAQYLYDPFGKLLSLSGPLAEANTYRFSSKEAHEPSGLVYFGCRFYEPNFQRWLNPDPLEEHDDVNLFRYVRNSPVFLVDPFGLYALDEDGFPVTATGTALDSYIYDDDTRQRHNEIMDNVKGTLNALWDEIKPRIIGPFDDFESYKKNLPFPDPLDRIGKLCDAFKSKPANESVRIRHYTNAKGLTGIEKSRVIRASDQNKVFAESARGKPLSPRDAETTYGLKRGRGRNYVETDVPADRVRRVYNPLTKSYELQVVGDVPLESPTFHSR